MTWHPVTPTSPRPEELPVTVVRSRQRNHAYWTAYQTEEKVTDEMKQTVAQHFDQMTDRRWWLTPEVAQWHVDAVRLPRWSDSTRT